MAMITQRELNERIRQHEEWLKNEAKGNSPSFAGLDLSGLDLAHCGLKGSPTKVRGTFTPTHEKNGQKIEAETGDEAGRTLVKLLSQAKLIG